MIVSQAWRSWRNAKGVALLATAALAIGIGATTAIYSVVNAVMLKPLPYPDGDRFVAIFAGSFNDPERIGTLSADDVRAFQERTRAFDAFGWFRGSGQNLMFGGEPHHVEGVRLTIPLAHALGVDPVLGRWFVGDTGVMLSHALWRRLGSDHDIVGKPITLDGRPYVVAGVMPGSFRFPVGAITSSGYGADVWMPLDTREADAGYFAYARRKPGIGFAAAVDDVTRVAAEIAAEDPATHPSYTARVYDLRETVVKEVRPTLLLLFAAAGLLFAITCANAAGLLLARAVTRARETATRVALGAARGSLAAQFFVEGLGVAAAGAAGGILLAVTLVPAIVRMAADYIPRAEEVSIDWTVFVFAVAAAVAASALSSLAPLWQAVRTAPADALGEGVRASASARSRRVSRTLVVAEVALAFGLLAVSAMLIGHLRQLSRTAPGFEPAGVLSFTISVPGQIAQRADTRLPYQQRLLDAVAAVPGVESAAFANQLPLDGCCMSVAIYPEGRAVDTTLSQRMSLMAVSGDYFRTMRVPLQRGRLLTVHDLAEDLVFVVISQATATRYWGSDDPVGAFGRFNRPDGSRFQVLGVVGDVKNDGLGRPTVPEIYVPSAVLAIETTRFVVRSQRPEPSLVADMRQALRRVDPEQPVYGFQSMDDMVAATMTLERVASLVTGFFALAALVLATLAIYGFVAYSVRQRTVEIGTRMAIGATSRDVLRLIVGDGLRLATAGVVGGGVFTLLVAAYLQQELKLTSAGPAPFAYSALLVGAIAFTASLVPASRAALLSPLVALRNEPGSMWRAARGQVARLLGDSEPSETGVLTSGIVDDVADAVRRADSFDDALQMALSGIRDRLDAESIVLLRRRDDAYVAGDLVIPSSGVLANRLRHYSHPLGLSDADLDTWSRWARERRSTCVQEIDALRTRGVRAAVPLRFKRDLVGILLVGPPAGRDGFAQGEKQALDHAADILALMIENARLSIRELEQEKLRRDLALAQEVQRRLLPRHPPAYAAGTLAAFTLPARSVGGDYYDFVELPGGRLGLAIADVAGKGISAALLMSVVQASLRLLSSSDSLACASLATSMNRHLYASTAGNKYATFFYAEVDAAGTRLRYVNAGHNPPYLVKRTAAGSDVRQLTAGGTVLGLFAESDYEAGDAAIGPGDLFVAFTDGVSEASNEAGVEFGEARIEALLAAAVGQSADDVAATLTGAVRTWMGAAEQHDDITFIVLAVNGQPATVGTASAVRAPEGPSGNN